jgi:hypothetical protein
MRKYFTDIAFMGSLSIFLFSIFMMTKNFIIPEFKKSSLSAQPSHSISASSPNFAPVFSSGQMVNGQAAQIIQQKMQQIQQRLQSLKFNNSPLILHKMKTKSPGVYVVANDGSGDSTSLKDVLNQISNSEKIILKKGSHVWPDDIFFNRNIEIKGEGPESIIEVSKTIFMKNYKMIMSNLKVIHKGESCAFAVTVGAELNLQRVHLIGHNENTGIEVRAGNLFLNDVQLERFFWGLRIVNPLQVDINDVSVSHARIGAYIKSDDHLKFQNFSTDFIREYAIYFDEKYYGKLTCTACKLGLEKSNDQLRIQETL